MWPPTLILFPREKNPVKDGFVWALDCFAFFKKFLKLKLYHNIKSKKLIYMKLLFRSKPKILTVGSGFQCALWEIVKRPGETYCVILRLKVWNS